MPRQKRPDPLYQRGDFKLFRPRSDRRNLEIIWYDADRGRERSTSAGTDCERQGRLKVDRLYKHSTEGPGFCPTCLRPHEHDKATASSIYVAAAIADYLTGKLDEPAHGALQDRLGHVVEYLKVSNPQTTVTAVDEPWIAAFRKHELARPIVSPTGKERPRSPSTVENSVIALASAIRAATGQAPRFKPIPTTEVNRSPTYRADIQTLAAMFLYCLYPQAPGGARWSADKVAREKLARTKLLQFLRISVATWCRPDAAYDFSTERGRRQWFPECPAIALNPHGRRQTRKVRPTVPAPRQIVPLIEMTKGQFVGVASVKSAWESMCAALDLPGDGEAGTKLIRRSVSTIARRRIGERDWVQGETMLGHRKASTSDIYALPDPAHLGLALLATEAIIDEIEALVPGAYTAGLPQARANLSIIMGGRTG